MFGGRAVVMTVREKARIFSPGRSVISKALLPWIIRVEEAGTENCLIASQTRIGRTNTLVLTTFAWAKEIHTKNLGIVEASQLTEISRGII